MKQTDVKPVACNRSKKNFITDFHNVCVEDHPVLFWLKTLRYLGLLLEYPLVFIESMKIRPVHLLKWSDTQKQFYRN